MVIFVFIILLYIISFVAIRIGFAITSFVAHSNLFQQLQYFL